MRDGGLTGPRDLEETEGGLTGPKDRGSTKGGLTGPSVRTWPLLVSSTPPMIPWLPMCWKVLPGSNLLEYS